MKTKASDPIPTLFPTCGEVFHFLVSALDVTAWADAFSDPKTKRRESSVIKDLSDRLRDWATETEGRVPGRDELEEFLKAQVGTLPRGNALAFVLCASWRRVLEQHALVVCEDATFLDRHGTRSWYARSRAPSTLYFIWHLQKLFKQFEQTRGPMLDVPLDELLGKMWPATPASGIASNHPLYLTCCKFYEERRDEKTSLVDAKTVAAWKSGEDRPSFDALGRHFSKLEDKLGLLLNFAFAGLLEELARGLQAAISEQDWPDCCRLLLGQARCMHQLDEQISVWLTHLPDLSLPDYDHLLAECLGNYMELLQGLPRKGLDALDLRVAVFGVYEEYQHRFVSEQPPMEFGEFLEHLGELWNGTALRAFSIDTSTVEAKLAILRADHPRSCDTFAGPLLAIEARLALRHIPPSEESVQTAFALYQKAFAESRYRTGVYTAQIAREALGLAALLHRHETGGRRDQAMDQKGAGTVGSCGIWPGI